MSNEELKEQTEELHEHCEQEHHSGDFHKEHKHQHHHGDHEHEEGISCSCGHCHHHEHGEHTDGHEHSHEHEHGEEITLNKILFSLAVFATALIASHIPAIKSLSNANQYNFGGTNLFAAAITLFYFIAYINVGLPVIKNAVYGILHGEFLDEQFLMAIASIGAICLGEYPEAVAVMIFYQLGEYFQDYAVDKSKKSIKSLMKLRPDSATVLRGTEKIVEEAEKVQIGETILVKPGERIPLDGVVTKGKSFADTSMQTGESVPVEIFEGSEVLAGFINMEGVLEIKVSKSFSESSVSRILKLIENASDSKARSEKFIKKFARIYTPAVCAAALALALIPPLFAILTGNIANAGFAKWISRALIFLVVSCPCALVISVPLSFFGGIGSCSRKGILVKGSNHLETLSKVKTAVFDKTGTLTKGVFVVSASHPSRKLNFSEEELVALATHAEYYSTHPIAKSLRLAHSCESCGKLALSDIKEIPGKGLSVTIRNQKILVGNEKLMLENHVQNYETCAIHNHGTIIHVSVDGQYAGHIEISDKVKDESRQAILELKKSGIHKIFMLTGDKENVAKTTAAELGIDKVFSELLPEEKVKYLEKIIAENEKSVMFVGDGINDAPSLARADVGVAMEALGSDAAMEASDVVIMSGNLTKLVQGIKTAKRTMNIVNQNIIFSLAVKFAIMALGAAGLANMWLAVFGDVGVTFIAVLNALRLLK